MKETSDLMSRLNNISNDKALNDFIKDVDGNYPLTFSEYIKKIMIERDLYKVDISKASLIDRSYTSQIIEGTKKPGRDKVLAIAIGLKLSIDETQKALKLAGLNELYPKSKRDSIIIFAINQKMNVMDTNAELARYGEAELA
ncbi:MAG: helix-turn-helix transcriptional regulator [Clostridiales bacterium]|nr:helix-turn-helix transcriptional regulator [Clostridiales bacterium]